METPDSFCALSTAGGVECWGDGSGGELGDGTFSSSATPVAVEAAGRHRPPRRGGEPGGCRRELLRPSHLGRSGLLGSGLDGDFGYVGVQSARPVQVAGVGGTGTLSGVASLTAGRLGSFCALLSSGGVDCWGDGCRRRARERKERALLPRHSRRSRWRVSEAPAPSAG